jgi:hypothetical protein
MARRRNKPTLADDLIEALGEAVAHANGERELATRIYASTSPPLAANLPRSICSVVSRT